MFFPRISSLLPESRRLLVPLALALAFSAVSAQDPALGGPQAAAATSAEPPLVQNPGMMDGGVIRLQPGELPDYDVLRFTGGQEGVLEDEFLGSIPSLPEENIVRDNIIFPDVDPDEPYALLTLDRLIAVALEGNLNLLNGERGLLIARSSVRSAEATFIPFVDLVADSRLSEERNQNATRTDSSGDSRGTTRETGTFRNSAGLESGVTLPTGGQVSVDAAQSRSDSRVTDGGGVLADDDAWASDANVRFVQPLLRGAGSTVATADLRRSRISEIDRQIAFNLSRRDVALNVIQSYLRLLQIARQLQVSRDAIVERVRFLEETQIRFNVGRVDESAILRAELNYLSELETAISRRQSLDDERENMLILLGLPLETPISFIDITPQLAERGRVDIPDMELAVEEALSDRLELMRADLSLALAELDLKLAMNDVLPDLDFDAGYGRSDQGDNYGDINGWESSSWDAGLSLRIPLVNIRRREAARRSAISLEQEETSRLQTVRDIVREVRRAHRAVLSTEAQLTILSKNVEVARKSLDLINGRFEVGFANITEVRLAQDDLFAAETRYSNTLLNYQLVLARLYVALGRSLY